MSRPSPVWSDMTWQDIARADTSEWIAVLPVAAIEQHGPHLPLSTDLDIMHGYQSRVLGSLPQDLPVTFLPIQPVGLSPEHAAFPGTLTLSPETALRTWAELGESLARAGIRKILLLSSHGGNTGLMEVAARELRARHRMLAVTASFSRFGYPENLFSADEISHGIHGGEIETSLMLVFRPELVRRELLRNFVPASLTMKRRYSLLRTARPAGFGWLAQDLHAEGALGDSTASGAGKGHAAAEHGARALISLLRDMAAFPLNDLAEAPSSSA